MKQKGIIREKKEDKQEKALADRRKGSLIVTGPRFRFPRSSVNLAIFSDLPNEHFSTLRFSSKGSFVAFFGSKSELVRAVRVDDQKERQDEMIVFR